MISPPAAFTPAAPPSRPAGRQESVEASSESGDRDADGRDLSQRPRPLADEEAAEESNETPESSARLDVSV